MQFQLSHLPSPLGEILLVTDSEHHIRALDFVDHQSHLHRGLRERYGEYDLVDAQPSATVVEALQRYFAGDLQALNKLAVVSPGTDLQKKVWLALRDIPAGTTTSYGKLARALGFSDPRAAIDIGAAIGSNPIAIVVPCHRVIASNGDLKGFAWGLPRKRWLLEHEKAIAPEPQTASLPGF